MRAPNIESPDFVKRFIEKAKVAAMSGTAFSMRGEKHARISCANSMEKISEAMDRVQRVIRQIMKF